MNHQTRANLLCQCAKTPVHGAMSVGPPLQYWRTPGNATLARESNLLFLPAGQDGIEQLVCLLAHIRGEVVPAVRVLDA
jgi:hypothetical protein